MTLIKPAARVGMGQNKALKTTPLKWPPHGMQHAKMPHGSLGISRLHLNGAYIYVGLHVYWYYVCMYVCIWPGVIWRCGCSTENPSGKCKTLATLNERLERGTSFPHFPFRLSLDFPRPGALGLLLFSKSSRDKRAWPSVVPLFCGLVNSRLISGLHIYQFSASLVSPSWLLAAISPAEI